MNIMNEMRLTVFYVSFNKFNKKFHYILVLKSQHIFGVAARIWHETTVLAESGRLPASGKSIEIKKKSISPKSRVTYTPYNFAARYTMCEEIT